MENYYTEKEKAYLKDFEYSDAEDLIEQIISCTADEFDDEGYDLDDPETKEYIRFLENLISKLRSKAYPLPIIK